MNRFTKPINMTNFKEKANRSFNGKLILYGAGFITLLLMMLMINPFGYNDLGYREVVETPTGQKDVIFTNGVYFKFPGSKVTTYPNVITISHRGTKNGSTVEGGLIPIRFNDATEASAQTVVRFRLPDLEKEMLTLHSEYVNNPTLSH